MFPNIIASDYSESTCYFFPLKDLKKKKERELKIKTNANKRNSQLYSSEEQHRSKLSIHITKRAKDLDSFFMFGKFHAHSLEDGQAQFESKAT